MLHDMVMCLHANEKASHGVLMLCGLLRVWPPEALCSAEPPVRCPKEKEQPPVKEES